MIQYMQPKNLAPIHGEFFMRQAHGNIAIEEGLPQSRILLAENGGIIEVKNREARLVQETIPSKYILIDGLGMGSGDHAIVSDRKHMSENGVMIPLIRIHQKSRKLKGEIDIVSRGFIYMDESQEIVNHLKEAASKAYREMMKKNPKARRGEIKEYIRQKLDKRVHKLIARRPLIIPVIIEA
jgi:ribonuclease J